MGKLLCEKNLRDVWCRNESVRAEIGQILHTHAAKLVVEISIDKAQKHIYYSILSYASNII